MAEENAAKNAVYDRAVEKMREGSIAACTEAVSLFSRIPGWKNSDLLATRCFERIARLREEQKRRRKRRGRALLLVFGAALILALASAAVLPGILNQKLLSRAKISFQEEVQPEEPAAALPALTGAGKSEGGIGAADGVPAFASAGASAAVSFSGSGSEGTEGSENSGETLKGDIGRRTGPEDPAEAEADGKAVEAGSGGKGMESSSGGKNGDAEDPAEAEADGKAVEAGSGGKGTEPEKPEAAAAMTGAAPAEAENNGNNTGNNTENSAGNSNETAAGKKGGLAAPLQILTIFTFGILAAAVMLLPKLLRPALRYRKACALLAQGQAGEAREIFLQLGTYRDSREKAELCEKALKDRQYEAAAALQAEGRFEEAAGVFEALGGCRDSSLRAQACREAMLDRTYAQAKLFMQEGQFEAAAAVFSELGKYRDSVYRRRLCREALEKEPDYRRAVSLYAEGKEEEALELFRNLREYRDAGDYVRKIMSARYESAVRRMKEGDLTGAIAAFSALEDYSDSPAKIMECRKALLDRDYEEALARKAAGRYEEAVDLFRRLRGHRDSRAQAEACCREIRAPRPFDRLRCGQPAEEILAVFGEPEQTAEAENGSLLSYSGIGFLGTEGSMTLEFEQGLLHSARWRADFSWKTGTAGNAGRYPVTEYERFREYYTSLFGDCVSDYLRDGHKGCWWRKPGLTVDVNDRDYVTILCDL